MVLSPAASATVHRLPATPSTVHWGYFDPRLEPVLTVAPGDFVAIETLTHHAGEKLTTAPSRGTATTRYLRMPAVLQGAPGRGLVGLRPDHQLANDRAPTPA